jgi:hypothetical protein
MISGVPLGFLDFFVGGARVRSPAPNHPNTFLIFRLFWKAFVAENEPMASATQVGAVGLRPFSSTQTAVETQGAFLWP